MAANFESDKEPAAPDNSRAARMLAVRRRLLRGGVGVAPVVLTLSSGRVMGAQTCASVSAFGSMAALLSRPGKAISCIGQDPLAWKLNNTWPSGCLRPPDPTPTKFSANFSIQGNMTLNTTLFDILNGVVATGGAAFNGNLALAQATVAALLNNKLDITGVPQALLPLSQIQTMWSNTAGGGTFPVPNTVITWNSAQVLAYLQSTYDAV